MLPLAVTRQNIWLRSRRGLQRLTFIIRKVFRFSFIWLILLRVQRVSNAVRTSLVQIIALNVLVDYLRVTFVLCCHHQLLFVLLNPRVTSLS